MGVLRGTDHFVPAKKQELIVTKDSYKMSDQNQSKVAKDNYFRTLELDLESIGECAEPSYHKNYAPPHALAMLRAITSNGHTVVEEFDYQITRVELKPIRIRDPKEALRPIADFHHDCDHSREDPFYETQMKKVRERQERRCYESEEFKEEICHSHFHNAFHTYVAESTENGYEPLDLIPKRNKEGRTEILTYEGVDYVRSDILNDADAYAAIEQDIDVPPKASVDQWPEEVVIYPPDAQGAPTTYIRGDVIYFEGNVKKDHRLEPT